MGQRDVLDYDEEASAAGGSRFKAWLVDLLKTWIPAGLAVFAIRSAIAEPFRIPSGSMVPTLEIGDHILVSKMSYGLKLPFSQEFGNSVTLLPFGSPERGDIIVFRWPPNPDLDYIKRIVGLPGDIIEVKDNQLYVNGEEASLRRDHAVDRRHPPPIPRAHHGTANPPRTASVVQKGVADNLCYSTSTKSC